MKYRNWGVALIICVMSLGGLFMYTQNNRATLASVTDTVTSTRGVCYITDVLEIQKLVYTYGNQNITIEQQNGHFMMEDKEKETFVSADERYIYKLLDQFAAPVYNEVVSIAPSDLSDYGITSESQIVTLTDNDGKTYTLVNGKDNYVYAPHADAIYKMRNNPFEVLTFNRDTWVSKELATFNKNDIQSIDLNYKTLHTTLMPKEDGTFTNNILGDNVATEFIRFLETTEASYVVTEEANAFARSAYGFDNPNLTCTLYFVNRDSITITIGIIESNENKCYAMASTRPDTILAIPFFEFFSRSLYAALDDAIYGGNGYVI